MCVCECVYVCMRVPSVFRRVRVMSVWLRVTIEGIPAPQGLAYGEGGLAYGEG